MESRNILTMCRLCLCENERFVNIFEVNDCHGYVAAEVIHNLLQFHVFATDGYPQVVCPTCLAKLTEFKAFKESCRMSRDIYDNVFASEESPEEELPKTDLSHVIKEESVDIVEDLDHCQDPLQEIEEECVDIAEDSGHCSKDVAREILEESVEIMDDSNHNTKVLLQGVPSKSEDTLKYFGRYSQSKETPKLVERKKSCVCHCCGKVLACKGSLKVHLMLHGKFHECKVCGRKCQSKNHLAVHYRSHFDERPFECTDCKAKFKNKSSLKSHMAVHVRRKPYACKVCGLQYSCRSNLELHMTAHEMLKDGLNPSCAS